MGVDNKRTAAQVLSHKPGHREISAEAGSSQGFGKYRLRNKYCRKQEVQEVQFLKTSAKMGSSPSHFLLGLLCLLLRIRDYGQWCEEGGIREGCRLVPLISGTFECVCSTGCLSSVSQLPFSSREQCQAHLTEQRSAVDVCQSSPCQNKGECIQRKFGGHRCDCTGTGFYGQACQVECPKNRTSEDSSTYPAECV